MLGSHRPFFDPLMMAMYVQPWSVSAHVRIALTCTMMLLVSGGPQTGVIRRALLQPASSESVAAPAGTTVLLRFRGVGTQNYTGQSDTTYKNTGARADLYTSNEMKGAVHFFDAAGEATWVIINSSTGAQEGLVHGRPVATAPTLSQPDDGGFGSVASLLLQAHGGEGALATCTYIQRLNVLGGGAPKGFFTLPAWNGIPDAEATFPYQADYILLSGGTSGTVQADQGPPTG